ncbi:hypothetical protein [Glycomyces xiaoerkulensis]|uniref:hypothetical protein n=1 Tax=Glycomyces xiaoerkulensis TaxID=2038139 RepID=UPI000C259AB7|nr:hypothetical protein [Glycomyces xiaoerkulensis]
MGDRIRYDPQLIDEVGRTACPDIANFYDDITSQAADAGRGRSGAFGDHDLAGTWNDMFNLFYEIVHETGQNVRTLGPTLIEIAQDQEILEGELVQSFGDMESEIEDNGYDSSPSENYEDAPAAPPDPDEKDENPYADHLNGGYGPY